MFLLTHRYIGIVYMFLNVFNVFFGSNKYCILYLWCALHVYDPSFQKQSKHIRDLQDYKMNTVCTRGFYT